MDNLIKKAEELDQMRSKNISEKLTLEEAQNIVNIWGVHLEHSGGTRIIFGANIPRSLLPYPIEILQGALNKMEAHYHSQKQFDRVKLLEETEAALMWYTEDREAVKLLLVKFKNKKPQEAFSKSLKDYQVEQAQNGYLVDKKLWKISKSRIQELLR